VVTWVREGWLVLFDPGSFDSFIRCGYSDDWVEPGAPMGVKAHAIGVEECFQSGVIHGYIVLGAGSESPVPGFDLGRSVELVRIVLELHVRRFVCHSFVEEV
jgi:hypothetical protein